MWEPAGSRNGDHGDPKNIQQRGNSLQDCKQKLQRRGWTGGGVEGTLLGAKLGLTFINICMNDLAETINSTLMRSPARQAGSKGQILSSAAAAHRAHKAG